ncbi:MAG TPA: hypothetical protein PLH43_06795 [Acetivibrio sp.]|uniref:hypothetical protein n=1 Tax=Acetivibrio sp. TaxID=1872092 RepID=UPI002CAA0FBD|nr:hypothetical protein [Acetivibrio sp.]HOM02520.1 hypothetical protein [Acetivibrio sp.]
MEFIKDFTRKVTDTAKFAARKSSDMVEITKLNFNIGTEEDKIKRAYAQMGEIVYRSFENGEEVPADLKALCEKVADMKKNIEQMKQQILRIKSIKVCPSCKEELPEEVAYCPKCGTKQEVVVRASQEQKEENNEQAKGEDEAQNNTECSEECNEKIDCAAENSVESLEENKEENSDNQCQTEEYEEK